MATDTVVEPPPSSLTGVAKVLVSAGKLSQKAAEDFAKQAKGNDKGNFVSTVIGAGALKSDDLAHTLAQALALPLIDLDAVDHTRLPKNLIDAKIAAQYHLLVLGKRGNRLFIGASDPTNQEAAERIKFATQLSPEWVIVEHDKLAKQLEAAGASANEVLESLASADFDFDVTDEETATA